MNITAIDNNSLINWQGVDFQTFQSIDPLYFQNSNNFYGTKQQSTRSKISDLPF